jgi:shikimate kinase
VFLLSLCARTCFPAYAEGSRVGGVMQDHPISEPMPVSPAQPTLTPAVALLHARLGNRLLVLVGMMGAGKSSIGRRLAEALSLAFVDADTEIERAAGQTISEIFAQHGEAYFRDGERRVIARLLSAGPQVVSTGGGAFMNAETRALVAASSISIWLKADIDVLMQRVRKRGNRPMLKTEDPEAAMRRLIDERYPVYAEANITVVSRDVPHEVIVGEIIKALGPDAPVWAKRDIGSTL